MFAMFVRSRKFKSLIKLALTRIALQNASATVDLVGGYSPVPKIRKSPSLLTRYSGKWHNADDAQPNLHPGLVDPLPRVQQAKAHRNCWRSSVASPSVTVRPKPRPCEKPRVTELGHVRLECIGRTTPTQFFDILEQSNVRAQRGEILEQKCELSALAEDFWWKAFKRTVATN
jgi:hypothetical protein